MCTAEEGIGAKLSFAASRTPEVPSETKASPSLRAPTPQAAAALSPPPPTTITLRPTPQRSASSERKFPIGADPSNKSGTWSCRIPDFDKRSGDHSLAPQSSHEVPAASDISDT